MVERFNRTLLRLLSIAAEESEEDWDLKLSTIMMAYRSSIHESTGETPFTLMFGREVQLPVDIIYSLPKESCCLPQICKCSAQAAQRSLHKCSPPPRKAEKSAEVVLRH